MAVVTWDGKSFPYACRADGGPFPIEGKELAFPGVDGIAIMDMGKRQRRMTIRGRLLNAAGGAGALSAADIRALDTGKAATLAADGESFANCIVDGASTRVFGFSRAIIAGVSQVTCQYEVTFVQLRE